MRLTIAFSKIKKQNLVLINNDTHQRETVSERPIRPPLSIFRLSLVDLEANVHSVNNGNIIIVIISMSIFMMTIAFHKSIFHISVSLSSSHPSYARTSLHCLNTVTR